MDGHENKRTEPKPVTEFRLPDGTGDVLATRIREIHERVAQATERRAPEALAAIAVHFDRGGRSEKAFEYALLVADRARATCAHQQAFDFLRIAERNTSSPEQLAEVRVRMAQAAEGAGRYTEAEGLCAWAIEWFSTKGDRARALSLRRMGTRLRGLLGEPASRVLGDCLALDDEARELGVDSEHVALLVMISQAYGKMGEREAAERIARECVRIAEGLGDGALLADALNRLAITQEGERPMASAELYRRALAIYGSLGDRRGEARCHNNLGILHTRQGDWVRAREEFNGSISITRAMGMTDLWGLAALNLGVVHLRDGEHDSARDLFGEAFAVFATVKHGERQLYALYNLAHLDREQGQEQAAAELYDVAALMAERYGQSDVEIGARAGAGLALLAQRDIDGAYASLRGAEERMRPRRDWFQGRELVEALAVRLAAADGRSAAARERLDAALALAEPADPHGATWLVADCAIALLAHDPAYTRQLLAKALDRATTLGFTMLRRRCAAVLGVI
jgi:tetratricopeptide (TPR) repeat protein